jgi:hypothetical protein
MLRPAKDAQFGDWVGATPLRAGGTGHSAISRGNGLTASHTKRGVSDFWYSEKWHVDNWSSGEYGLKLCAPMTCAKVAAQY